MGLTTIKALGASRQMIDKANKQQEVWITPTLINGWVAEQPIKFRKDEFGKVTIKGKAKSGVANTVIFALPLGYRPSNSYSGFVCFNGTTEAAKVYITSSGNVTIESYSTGVYLDNISFFVD